MRASDPTETYVSIDIEANGPVPGLNSMLSLGAAAFAGAAEIGRFYEKLREETGTVADPAAMAFWAAQPQDVRDELAAGRRHPGEVTWRFVDWVESLPGDRKIAVAAPASFDFAFVNWYCRRYADRNPLGHECFDVRSYAAGILRSEHYYRLKDDQFGRLLAPREAAGLRLHVAINDAVRQGRVFVVLQRCCWDPELRNRVGGT